METKQDFEAGCVPSGGAGGDHDGALPVVFKGCYPGHSHCSPSSSTSVDLSVAKRSSIYCKEQPLTHGER